MTEKSGKNLDVRQILPLAAGLGIAIGAGIGAAMESVALGAGVGLVLGAAIGAGLSWKRRQKSDKGE